MLCFVFIILRLPLAASEIPNELVFVTLGIGEFSGKSSLDVGPLWKNRCRNVSYPLAADRDLLKRDIFKC